MIKEKVESYFQRFPELRILFFFDENKEYQEEVKALDLADIHTEYYTNNPFSIKCKLLDELAHKKVLLYLPMAQPNYEEAYHAFPLLGLLIANKELQLDNVGNFMEDHGLQRHQKALVDKYISELKYAGIQHICKPVLNVENFEEHALQQGLVSAFLKCKKIESWSVLTAKLISIAVLKDASETDKFVHKIQKLNFQDELIQRVVNTTGIRINELSQASLKKVARGVLYNKLTYTIDKAHITDPYAKLKVRDSKHLAHLNQMLHDVDRTNTLKLAFEKAMLVVGSDIKGAKLIEIYGADAAFAEYNPEMIWTIIGQKKKELQYAPAELIKILDTISLQAGLSEIIKNTLKYMVQLAKMYQYIHRTSYILDSPEDYIHYYIQHGYKLDSSYRKAIGLFKQLDVTEISDELCLEDIHADLNANYDKHTDELNRQWLKCLHEFNFDYSKLNVAKQYDFYKTEIADRAQKVVVIISDALRYEAATELLSEMHADAKNTAEIRYMLASIPSKTNVGMAQLLPGNKSFNKGDITADGMSTSGTDNRSLLLQCYNKDARAIQYSDLEGLSQKEKREVFKSSLVYVYHDVIDATGDKKPSERRTFNAVADAIEELKRFVKNLHATLNVSNVIVTSDHGFLYKDKEIEEKDKENIVTDKLSQSGNRYFITEDLQQNDLLYSIPLSSTTLFTESAYVNIPLSVNRYKKQGVGHQFAHGGGSLQELIVPLIESTRQRVEVAKKVSPQLVIKNLIIVSNILKVTILQETKVSRLEKERTLKVGLYSASGLVSNEEICRLNFTSESASERVIRIDLNLLPDSGSVTFLKLKIFDEEDMLNPVIEERVQNNTLIQTDF